MLCDKRIQQRMFVGLDCALVQQKLSELLLLVEYPIVHRLDECLAADEIHLQCQDAKEEIAVGGGGHGEFLARVDGADLSQNRRGRRGDARKNGFRDSVESPLIFTSLACRPAAARMR